MAFNTIEEIKDLCLLETENQTLNDQTIQSYLDDANLELYNEINRKAERDSFISEKAGSITFYPYFNVLQIRFIKVNDTLVDEDDYRICDDGDGVEIDDIEIGDVIEIHSIPPNYKMLERAIFIINLRTRLNPFKNDSIDPIYNEWIQKRDNFKKALKSKFGTALYNG